MSLTLLLVDFSQIELIEEGTPRKLRVYYKHLDSGEEGSVECNTVSILLVWPFDFC